MAETDLQAPTPDPQQKPPTPAPAPPATPAHHHKDKPANPAGGLSGDFANQAMQSLMQGDKQLAADTQELKQTVNKTLMKIGDMKVPPPPEMKDKPEKPPQYKPQDPMQSFGSLSTILAILAGFMTKAPLTAGLNAAAGAMTAARKGDLENYDYHMKEWKANNDYAKEMMNWQQTNYMNAINNRKMAYDELMGNLSIMTQMHKDEVGDQQLKRGDLGMFIQMQQDRQRLAMQWDEHRMQAMNIASEIAHRSNMEKIEREKAFDDPNKMVFRENYNAETDKMKQTKEQAIADKKYGGDLSKLTNVDKAEAATFSNEERAQIGNSAIAAQTSAKRMMGGAAGPDDPGRKMYARSIASYNQPLTVQAQRMYGPALIKDILELNPDYQAPLYNAKNKFTQSILAGKDGDNLRFFGTALSHIDLLSRLGKALDNNDDPQTLSYLKNMAQTEFGFDPVTNFESAKNIVTDEIIKAVMNSPGGVHDREAIAGNLKAQESITQLAGQAELFTGLMAGQLEHLEQKYINIPGNTSREFKLLMMPQDALAYEKYKSNINNPSWLPGQNSGQSQTQTYNTPEDLSKAIISGQVKAGKVKIGNQETDITQQFLDEFMKSGP